MNVFSIPPLLSAIAFMALGLFIISKNTKAKINILFACFCFSTFWWQFSWFILFNVKNNDYLASALVKLGYTGITFITVFILHCMILILDLRKQLRFVYLNYVICIILLLFLWTTNLYINGFYRYFFGYYPKANIILHSVHLIQQLIFGGIYVYIILWMAARKYKNMPLKYAQTKYLFIAGIIYFLAASDYLVNYGIEFYPLGFIPIIFTASIMVFTIIRYRLMDIDTVVHRTILWAMTLVLLVLPIGVMHGIFKTRVSSLSVSGTIMLDVLVIAFVLWYYRRLKPKIDHLFRRRKYDYYAVLGELGQKIGSELELEKVGHRIFKELKEILYIRNGILLAQQPGQEDYEEIGSVDTALLSLPFSSKFSQYLNREQKALEREQVEADPQYQEIREEALAWLKQKEIEVLIPIVLERKVNGLIGIGKKENLQGYTQKDIELLEKMGRQLGVTIDNALHHEDIVEKGRLAEEMKLGQEIQLNLLPKEAPQVEGLKITGLMIPAKEIGGDYYDYIVTSNKVIDVQQGETASGKVVRENSDTIPLYHSTTDRLSIVIGDVSGKGVAAGLIMATAKATLKGLSKQNFTPKEMLAETNRLLFEYTKGEKFMTMLYLIWDNQQKKLNYSSAGHEHIIIYRSGKVVEAQQGEPAGDKEVENSVSVVSGKVVKGISEQKDITTVPLYHSITGSVEVIQSGGFVLGMLPEIGEFLEDKELQLNTGDKVILYTDGVTEAHDPQGELYSLEKLTAAVQRHGHKPANELIEAVRQEVYGFISTQDQYDDITLVGIEDIGIREKEVKYDSYQ